jgi:hypothetical protein
MAMKQKLREGWAIDKVLLTEVDRSDLQTSGLTQEDVTEKIVSTAAIIKSTIA